MFDLAPLEPVDYLLIGHLTCDITPNGLRLGGAVTYASLMAKAMGLRVGLVTAWGNEFQLSALDGICVVSIPTERSTTFENIYTPNGRIQYLHYAAPKLDFSLVPEVWRRAPIIHLAPVAQEIDPVLPSDFRPSLLGLTLQGWLRSWDENHLVHPCAWERAEEALSRCGAAIVSMEDVGGNEEIVEQFMLASRLLVVTEGASGVRVFWNHDSRRFRPPMVQEVEVTGAGDIFATAFFARLYATRDPWEAARFANRLASISVTRRGLDGVPTPAEVQECLVEVI